MLRAFRSFGRALGTLQARLVLTLFYLTILVPFALLARARRPLRAAGWRARREATSELSRARLQF